MNCPRCKSDLTGDPIPLEDQELFGGHTHFGREIGLYDRDKDCTVAWKCPDCGHEWPRSRNEAGIQQGN